MKMSNPQIKIRFLAMKIRPKNGTKPYTDIILYYSVIMQNYNYRNRKKIVKCN